MASETTRRSIPLDEVERIAELVSRRAYRCRVYGGAFLAVLMFIIAALGSIFLAAGHITTIDEARPELTAAAQLIFVGQIAFTRLSAIIMAVFLIQIVIQFSRYYFRLADYMDARADAIRLSGGDVEDLQTLVQALSPSGIEFGKIPSPLPSKLIDVLQEAVKKIPTR